MTVFFVSDIHLTEDKPDIAQAFFGFMDHYQAEISTIYLMGDLFEFWIGDQSTSPVIEQFKQRLRTLSDRKARIYIQHGNRDFLIGKTFCQQTGAQLLADPFVTELGPGRVLLSHGDLYCTDDHAYQRLRKILRCRMTLALANALPYAIRLFVAHKIRTSSSKRQQLKYQQNKQLVDVNESAIQQALDEANCPVMIHGHTHRPALHSYDQERWRMVLGDWSAQGGVFARLNLQSNSLDLIHYHDPSHSEDMVASLSL